MKTGKSISELAQEILVQNKLKRDFLLNTQHMWMTPTDDNVYLSMADINKDQQYTFTIITDTAHNQIADAINMPMKYYNLCLNKEPGLLVTNVNTWLYINPSNKMLRTLGNKARALLSDRYRRIDNYDVLNVALPIINDIPDASVESAEITETKMFLKIVNPRLEAEVTPGDIIQSGLMISNSEVGKGRFIVQPLLYRLVCKNGMVVNDAGLRKYHVGREDDSNSLFSEETNRAIDNAFLLKVKDTIRSVTDEVKFNKFIEAMREAKGAEIEAPVQAVVELAGSSFGWGKSDGEGILNYLVRGGDLSLYGLAGAVTRYSQDVESYERATELESISYDVLTMPKQQWKNLNH